MFSLDFSQNERLYRYGYGIEVTKQWNQVKKLYNNIHRMKWKERIMFNIKRAGKPRVAFTILYFRKSLFETTTNSKIVVKNVHD